MRSNNNNNAQNQLNLIDNKSQYRHNLSNDSAHSPKTTKQLPFRQLQQHLQQQLQHKSSPPQQQLQRKSSPQQQQHQQTARNGDTSNNRGAAAKQSQLRKPSHVEKPVINDLMNVPPAFTEGAEKSRMGIRKKSSGMFYYDKANDGSPQAVKIDQSFHRSENPRPHHRTGGGGPDLNQTSHYQPSQIYNQSGNYVPIQTDSESPDGSSPLRQRRHKQSFRDSEDISSSSPSNTNQPFTNGQRPSRTTPRDRKQSTSNWSVPVHILDDLCCRFIINIPEEERSNHVRIFFQIELAYWFYLDFYCQDDPSLKPLGMREFSRQIFTHCPTLTEFAENVDSILDEWREYKMAVPTYGAILLDESMEYILLAQGFWAKASWGFPKGKVNEEEAPAACAIREVYEETGFDISALIDETSFIERSISDQFTRLYIVKGLSLDTKFHPKTRKEIRSLEWFRVDQLPIHKRDIRCKEEVGIPPNSFFMVIPFVREIRRWIRSQKNLGNSSSDDDQGILGPPPLMNAFDAQPYNRRHNPYLGFQQQSKTPHRRIDLGSDSGKGPSPPAKTPDHPRSNQKLHNSVGHPRSQRNREGLRGASSPADGGRPEQRNRHPSSSICVNLFSAERHNRGGGGGGVGKSADAPSREADEWGSSKFPTCKAWENFQLDVNQIMASFSIAS